MSWRELKLRWRFFEEFVVMRHLRVLQHANRLKQEAFNLHGHDEALQWHKQEGAAIATAVLSHIVTCL